MKNLLFPHIFQLIGWIMFVPSMIAGGIIFSGFLPFDGIMEHLSYDGMTETVINDIVIIGIALGSLFIVCSKERIEDEMTSSIRLSSILNSIYAYVALLVACTILINGVDFIIFAFINLSILPILFVCNFRLEMHRYNKMFADEEQD
ncbi:MAG: hypothetical protein K2H38_08680 [Muribaculaceae bacterium]|nr:hypothetical protein [Muribaculaceae bacterium]